MTTLSTPHPAPKSIHKYADTNLAAATVESKCALSSMTHHTHCSDLMLEGDYCSFSFCCVNRGLKSWRKGHWIQGSSLPKPSSSPGPASSFFSDLLPLLSRCLYCYFFFKSLILWPLNQPSSAKYQNGYLSGAGTAGLLSLLTHQVRFPGYISVRTSLGT